MRSRPSLLLMRNLRSLAVVVLATLPCVAFAQWRVVAVSTEVDKMRFNTIIDAHSFMKNYRSGAGRERQLGMRFIRLPVMVMAVMSPGSVLSI